jgi:hypothetical protein
MKKQSINQEFRTSVIEFTETASYVNPLAISCDIENDKNTNTSEKEQDNINNITPNEKNINNKSDQNYYFDLWAYKNIGIIKSIIC